MEMEYQLGEAWPAEGSCIGLKAAMTLAWEHERLCSGSVPAVAMA